MTEPTESPDPWSERRLGVLVVVGMHLVFTAMTAGVAATGLAADSDILGTWFRNLGFMQGIYILPALITAGLVQRAQVAVGIGIGAGATLVASLIGRALM